MTPKTKSPQQTQEKSFMMEYLEEKFISVHKRMDDIDKDNENINVSLRNISHSVENIQLSESKHYLTCPNTGELEILKQKVSEFLFIKKYWKVFAISLALTLFTMFYTALKQLQEYQSFYFKDNIQNMEILNNKQNTTQNTRSIDSLSGVPKEKSTTIYNIK